MQTQESNMKKIEKIVKRQSTKPDTPEKNVPLFKFPQNKENFYIFYSYRKKSLIISFTKEGTFEEYDLNNIPKEKCQLCSSYINLDNCFYINNKYNVKYYCQNCIENNSTITQLKNSKEVSDKEYDIINRLIEYKNISEKTNIQKYSQYIDSLISLSNILSKNLEMLKIDKDLFNNQIKFIQNYFDFLLFYLDEVDKLKMKSLYLFIKNICIVSVVNYNKKWFLNNLIVFFKENFDFNIAQIRINMLKKIIHLVFSQEITHINDCGNLFKGDRLESWYCQNFLKENMVEKDNYSDIYDKFYLYSKNLELQFKINEQRKDSLNKEIKALHQELYLDIAKYYYSFNSVASKKVIERKIINMILFLIFKNNYDSFQRIHENNSIRNILIKELKNIKNFLNSKKEKDAEILKDKINQQISYYESQNDLNSYSSKSKSFSWRKTNNINNIYFNNNEKQLLTDYSISNFDNESYSTIFENSEINGVVEPKKLRVIIEFLFYIKDKTIDIIHILELNSICFFSLLNEQNIKENLNYNINNIAFKNDNNLAYAHITDINSIEKNNKVIFDKHKINPKESIIFEYAFNFIFNTYIDFDLNSKIEYIYNNMQFPNKEVNNLNNKINNNISILDNMEYEYDFILPKLTKYKKKVDEIYALLDEKYKEDPSYDSIQKYFESLSKKYEYSIISVNEPIIKFYKSNVEYFEEYENFYSLMKLYRDYEKIIENKAKRDKMIKECNDLLQKIEKYNYIKENTRKYLLNNNNIKEYEEYYKEWKRKNKNLAVKGYKLKDLLKDIKKLVPMNEKITISGRDKFNFTFILYLFQQQYFLKDYI